VQKRDLQDLWLLISQQGIKRVLRVLPERHPTRRKYLFNLENLFRNFQAKFHDSNPVDPEVRTMRSFLLSQQHYVVNHCGSHCSQYPKANFFFCFMNTVLMENNPPIYTVKNIVGLT